MAERSQSHTMDTGQELDAENLPEHQRTYHRFLKVLRYGIVIATIILIFLFWLWY